AVSSDWATGATETGNVAWTFAVDVPHGAADGFLPPDSQNPWRLRIDEGGFVNRSGRIAQFRVIWHAPGGDQTVQGGPLPVQTIEGQSVYALAPGSTTGVGGSAASAAFRYGPNPVASGGAVRFAATHAPAPEL